MSRIKEKKLNSIKTEIEEIKKYVISSDTSDTSKQNDKEFSNNNLNDTLILTNVVRDEDKVINNRDLDIIKNELKELKSVINHNNDLLKEILLKIK